MTNEQNIKTRETVSMNREEHSKFRNMALILTLIPLILSGISLKTPWIIDHIIAAVNIFTTFGGFILAGICFKDRKNRNIIDIILLIVNGFSILMMIAIILVAIIYNIVH